MDVINTWWSLEDLDLRCSGMLSSLTLELGRNMSSNLGMNSLSRVISPMAMRSHSTTDVTTKFGNLSSDIKKIGMTMIVTKLTLCCLFCLLRLLWSNTLYSFFCIFGLPEQYNHYQCYIYFNFHTIFHFNSELQDKQSFMQNKLQMTCAYAKLQTSFIYICILNFLSVYSIPL